VGHLLLLYGLLEGKTRKKSVSYCVGGTRTAPTPRFQRDPCQVCATVSDRKMRLMLCPTSRLENQVEVIAYQTKRVNSERIATFSLSQRLQEELRVCRFTKCRRAVVASIERMIDQTVGNQPQWTSHVDTLPTLTRGRQAKTELTPIFAERNALRANLVKCHCRLIAAVVLKAERVPL